MNNRERLKEIIIQLKQIKFERELTVQEIYGMVKAAGFGTSDTSVRRVFAPGSEEQNFRWQDTIQPIAQVLIGVHEEAEPLNAAEADALKQIALLKDSMIEDLQRENDQLKARIDQLEKVIISLRIEEYEKRLHEMDLALQRARNRVDKQDEQLERKDGQIKRKDDYIDRLGIKAGI